MKTGIYDQVISKKLNKEISNIDERKVYSEEIDKAEASQILSDYLKNIIEEKLNAIEENSLDEKIELVNRIIGSVNSELDGTEIDSSGKQLKAFLDDDIMINLTNKTAKNLIHPETSISYSSLFTGAVREPHMCEELRREIKSANRIDFLVSFIKWSGLRLLIDELREFVENGNQLRIITTSYMGATDIKAIKELSKLPNTEIKVSYDVERTRLHAKSYIFYRETGYSTAYVGSSNMSNPAMTSGLEWNVKITKKELPEVFNKIESTFDVYWNSEEFEQYTHEKYDILKDALDKTKTERERSKKVNYYFQVTPYRYQKMILDKLKAEREVKNSYKNLVVAATGCGKTIIAAFDYKAQCKDGNRPNLLFVAHRKEILEQSLECFREVLRDSEFGDLFVGTNRPNQYKHLFISVDMLNSRKIYEHLDKKFYDFIVIDECHHMTANSYQKVLDYFEPKILLGLTATPERMDGDSILPYFNNRIAAEIRLAEAINKKLLCPFQYFGISDTVDLSEVKWKRGGYDVSEINNLYVFNREVAKKRAIQIINSVYKYVSDIDDVKGLVFCVSIEHAKFMNEMFNEKGISSVCITGQTAENERASVKAQIQSGKVKFACVVDIFNEGVDLKEINTVLFLRPTESLTVFLQQLGRGLRIADNKECLTVLDFVGQANKRYNFTAKYNALLENTNRGLKKEIESGFISLPKGCYIKLEKKVRDIILKNIKNSIGTKNGIIEMARNFVEDTGKELTYANFLNTYDITPRMIYSNKFTFGELMDIAKSKEKRIYNDNNAWKKINRLALIDDNGFLTYMVSMLPQYSAIVYSELSVKDLGYWKMLYMTLFDKKPEKMSDFIDNLKEYLSLNKSMIGEMIDLMSYNLDKIDYIDAAPQLPYECNLRVYSTYTRAQALAALDYWNTSSEGVTRIKEKKTTCLFITLNKSNNYYSPSTSYHDYSINDSLFHWQSQNSTSEETTVGQRYIHNKEQQENILLFVREAKEDKYGSIPFMFLGTADYVSHTGNKPMSIIWRLHNKIPAKFIKITDKLGIG